MPFAILPTYPEIAADAQAEAAGLLPALAGRRARTVDSPIRLPDARKVPPRPAPALGADTRAVLLELGYGEAEVDDLLARGIVARSGA